jgi:hypothetical protein
MMMTVHNTRIQRGYHNNDDDVEDTTTTMRNDEYNAKRMWYDTTTRIHLQGYDNEDTPTRLRQRGYDYKATKTTIDRHGGEIKMRGVMSWATMNREKSQTQWMAKWDYNKRYIARRSALILTFTCPPSSRRWVLDYSLAPSTGQNGLFCGYWTEVLHGTICRANYFTLTVTLNIFNDTYLVLYNKYS